MADWVRILVFGGVVLVLVALFFVTTAGNGFRLAEETKNRVSITPATTVSKFHRHFVAGLFHDNLVHIGFNLAIFTAGYWLATQRASSFTTVGASYGLGILVVFLLHLVLVLPLARLGIPYAERALDFPLVGFSVIAYACLGAGVDLFPALTQLIVFGVVILFEVGAGVFVTGPFISVYHVTGFALGFYVRSLAAP
ncbi:MAG TPA: hypothetical protein VGB18_06130 [Candidatus Thermoplasmatota archaeon]